MDLPRWPPAVHTWQFLAILEDRLVVSSPWSRACAPQAPAGTQILQAAPPTRIPPRSPFWRRRASTRSPAPATRHFQRRWGRSCAQVPSRSTAARPQGAHNRRQAPHPGMQGSRTGPGAPSQRRDATARRPQNRAPGTTRDPSAAHGAPGRSPQPRPASRPRALAARELRASAAARLGCPRAPSSRPGVGELRLAGGDLPARCPTPRADGARRKRRKTRRSHCFLRGSRLSRPSQSSVQPPPGRQGAERAARAQWEGWGLGWGSPHAPGSSCSYLRVRSGAPDGGLTSARSPFLSVPRLPRCSQPLGLGSPGSAPRRPRPPPTPPAPPPEAPPRAGGGGSRAAGAERRDRGRTWSARQPRPGPNQASRGGVPRTRGARKPKCHPCGVQESGASPRKTLCVDHCDPRFSSSEGDRGARGHLSAPPLLAQWPFPTPGPGSGGTFPSEPSRAGRGRQFGLSIVLLIRKDGRETTQRGGGPSGGGFVIPSFPPVLLSRTHLPTPPLGTQRPGEFYTG